jgi:phosphoribosylamine--glycine ligase
MNILIIGRGAREHAITWKIARSEQIEKIFCATGNSGVVDLAETVEIRAEDVKKLLAFAKKNNVSHVIPGPEVSYTEGIVELFSKAGIHVFGPGRHSFDLEISKAFAKELMCKHDIPTASFGVFSDQDSAFQYLQENSPPFIIKADGIDAGKGLIIARDEITARLAVNVILKDKIFGEAGKKIVIEELIPGQPVSVVAFTDGERILGATTVVIYQRAYDQDRGPFTGGMGAFSPDPRVDDKLLTQLKEDFLLPTIRGMAEENRPLKGIIYMNLI